MPYLSSLAALTRRHNKMLLISAAAIALAGAAGVVALSSGGPAHSQAAPQATEERSWSPT